MVEVPALALHAAAVATLVDVFSIGTNDLTQYTLAAERGNAGVAALGRPARPGGPAVDRRGHQGSWRAGPGRSVRRTRRLYRRDGAPRRPRRRELSMAAPAVPAAKQAVRSVSVPDAQALARWALAQDSAVAVRALVDGTHGPDS